MSFEIHQRAGTSDRSRGRRRQQAGRRRLWAGAIGAVLGWGIAGLDGGVAGTVSVPKPGVEFIVAGTLTTPELGTVPFDLASDGRFVREVLLIEKARLDMVYDREAGTISIVDADAVVVRRHELRSAGLFEPFAGVEAMADRPLEIFREGVGSHLGHACERYRAVGTADGLPVAVSACLTADGIPLFAERKGAGVSFRTELTAFSIGTPDPDYFSIPADRAIIDLTGGG